MKIEDFLAVMAENKEAYPQFEALPLENKIFIANLNIMTGLAHSYFDNEGNLFGVGGIRYVGLGEGWMITSPKIRNEQKIKLFRLAKNELVRIRDEKNLWRIFAESKLNTNFLEHLGFEEAPTTHIWTRFR